MHYYQRHIGDYARDTGHLSVYEHGVYALLLDRLYGTEKPITTRDANQIIRPATKRERESVQRVLDDFFTLTASGYINKRAVQEIEKYHEISHKRTESAKRRWQSGQQSHNANAMQVHSKGNAIQEPITNNQNQPPEIKKNKPSPPASTLAIAAQRGGGSGWVSDLVKPFSERK